MERQVRVLRRHFALARKHGLPLLMHCYKAHPALLQLFEEEAPPEAGVLMHSYSGGLDLAKKYTRLGCHFSLAGPVTFIGSRKPIAAAKEIPLDRLMLETDAPDQAPHPHRGQRCEPAHLPLINRALAQVHGLPEEALAEVTTSNAERFFRRRFGP
jgi:TatD DNase family protein